MEITQVPESKQPSHQRWQTVPMVYGTVHAPGTCQPMGTSMTQGAKATANAASTSTPAGRTNMKKATFEKKVQAILNENHDDLESVVAAVTKFAYT